MRQKTSNPAQRAGAGRARGLVHAGELNNPEIAQFLQELNCRRAQLLARRFRISEHHARVVASLAFSTGGGR